MMEFFPNNDTFEFGSRFNMLVIQMKTYNCNDQVLLQAYDTLTLPNVLLNLINIVNLQIILFNFLFFYIRTCWLHAPYHMTSSKVKPAFLLFLYD